MAIETDAESLGNLSEGIGGVEFKTTVVPADEDKVRDLLKQSGEQPDERKVYFYDTKELVLLSEDVVLRARINDGDDDDSTVKLRPVGLDVALAEQRTIGEALRIEVDVAPTGDPVRSAKLDGTPPRGAIKAVHEKGHPLGAWFSAEQQAVFARHAPAGITVFDLAVLGPVEARKWSLKAVDGFDHKLTIEKWMLPDDGGHFYELSFKVDGAEAITARDDFSALLERLGIDPGGQAQKTPRVLKFFADRL